MRKFVADDPKDPHFFHIKAAGSGAEKRFTFFFDREILCAACDNSLSDFDNAFVKFVAGWRNDPKRIRPILGYTSDRQILIDSPAFPLALGILTSLYRFSLSRKVPGVQLSSEVRAALKKMILTRGSGGLPYRILIVGYYHHWMEGRDFTVDVTEIGRPNPAPWFPNGYYMELFGLSIFIDITGHSGWLPEHVVGGDTATTKLHLAGPERFTPTFNHMLKVLVDGGARNVCPEKSVNPNQI